ncbi:MAG: cysteine--tRNA ligase, partial [Thermoanaerobaculia bacterium]
MSAGTPAPARFYNTLGRRLEPFEPLSPPRVGLYTCGPTVYNHVHIGNLRTFLFEDLLCRALRFLGYEVFQVMNLTDVDDRTIQGALAAGISLDDFTAPFVASFHDDLRALGVTPASVYPRATQHVGEMIALIERLVARGFAYESDGSIWFRIAADPDYGRLSGIDLSGARQGARVSSDDYEKEDAKDFVLWKGAKPGEPAWDSPWGPGRPGWHIECSAMSAKYLGETFDIHCGGVDNVFPHHENEIAQSESANGRPFVRYWLHSEHLLVDGEKMSKRLGNQYTLRDLLDRDLSPRAIRYALISVHYRQKLNFTFDGLRGSASALKRVDEMIFRLRHAAGGVEEGAGGGAGLAGRAAAFLEDFGRALADDLNVSAALAALFELVRDVNVAIERGAVGAADREAVERALREADSVLGVLFWDEQAASGGAAAGGPSDESIRARIEARLEARRRRDFAEADRLRDELAAEGVV